MSNEFVKKLEVYALATDPIYIGTGGYTIGRVDNTIVRDPITNVPKIPGSSLAGTWRYYVALEIYSHLKDEFKKSKLERKKELENFMKGMDKENFKDLDNEEKVNFMKKIFNSSKSWILFEGNRFVGIKCAGQDDLPTKTLEEMEEEDSGHCGHCIVCKGFGFSKKDISWQGQLFFSDLQILFFPVFTIFGTKWITTERILDSLELSLNNQNENSTKEEQKQCVVYEKLEEGKEEGYINLGWLYLPYKVENKSALWRKLKKVIERLPYELELADVVIVPESLFSQIVNSNLEVRTSVSIDPITGAAKQGALFTSEAIPRGTIFYGKIRIFDKGAFGGIEGNLKPLPDSEQLICALNDSKHFYETLGIGGTTTRGFGRMKVNLWCEDEIKDKEGFVICDENGRVKCEKEEKNGETEKS